MNENTHECQVKIDELKKEVESYRSAIRCLQDRIDFLEFSIMDLENSDE